MYLLVNDRVDLYLAFLDLNVLVHNFYFQLEDLLCMKPFFGKPCATGFFAAITAPLSNAGVMAFQSVFNMAPCSTSYSLQSERMVSNLAHFILSFESFLAKFLIVCSFLCGVEL